MKKIFIALTVLSAASGAAIAQSSDTAAAPPWYLAREPDAAQSVVNLYGLVDVAIGKATSAGDKKWGLQTASIVTSGPRSILGVTGKEDLGNGTWVGFNYQGDVNTNTGASDGWQREAWIGVGNSNTWGSVKLGRNATPAFHAMFQWELTNGSQYSVLADTFGWGGWAIPFGSAQIQYRTPTFYGVSSEIAYIPKGDGVVIDNGTNNESDRWLWNVLYQHGPFTASFVGDKLNHAANGGSNANKANWNIGGSYKFGEMFAVSASYSQTNNAQLWHGQGIIDFGARRYGFELGGSFFTGPFRVTLDLTRDTKNDLYGGKKYTNGVLEARYNLSMRTYLYADWLRLDGDNNYGIGIDHMF